MNSVARTTKKLKASASLPSAKPTLPVRRFTVDEYHKMVQAGVLKEREPYELIHGWIVQKMGINPPHSYSLTKLMGLLFFLRGSTVTMRLQMPVTTRDSEPEPDLVLAAGSEDDFADCNPVPTQIHLLVEVADTSLEYDRTTKLELYAQSKISVYWIVNLVDRCVEVYTEPRGGKKPAYKQQTNYGPHQQVPIIIDGKHMGRIPVKEFLPKV